MLRYKIIGEMHDSGVQNVVLAAYVSLSIHSAIEATFFLSRMIL